MSAALSTAALGFLLGLRHATDVDHLVAVTTIVTHQRRFGGAARVGAMWGVGHSITVLAIGGAIIAFRLTIPPRIGLGLELAVAVVLVALGVGNLVARKGVGPSHSHEHVARAGGMRALAVGIVHGLAGSAAVALLLLALIPDPAWAVAYLVVFGAGTIAGMTLITWLLVVPFAYGGAIAQRVQAGVRTVAGALSVGLGLFIAYEIVVRGGIFSANPAWTPH